MLVLGDKPSPFIRRQNTKPKTPQCNWVATKVSSKFMWEVVRNAAEQFVRQYHVTHNAIVDVVDEATYFRKHKWGVEKLRPEILAPPPNISDTKNM